jgi:transposase
MVKCETRFKLEIAGSFLAGEGGTKLLARRWSVPEQKIRTRVSDYRLHGVAALQPKRSAYTTALTDKYPTRTTRTSIEQRPLPYTDEHKRSGPARGSFNPAAGFG